MAAVGSVAAMATFRARDRSSAVLRSPRSEVWAALTDADLIAKITPYVTSIDVEGDRWTWRMGTIPVLGISVAPKFTEVMELHPQDRIVFTHDPDRPDEMTAVNGTYDLTDHADGGTDVSIDLADRLQPPAARPGPARGRARHGGRREAHGHRLLPQPPQAPGRSMRVLVLGATGYIGSRLVPHLLEHGHDVVAASSSPPRPDRFGWDDRVRAIRCDVTDPAAVAEAVEDVDAVVYLVHSLDRSDFSDRDRVAAETVAAAVADSGVRRLVYLSGLVPDVPEAELSDHIASRLEVERILLAAIDGSVALRAGVVIGAGRPRSRSSGRSRPCSSCSRCRRGCTARSSRSPSPTSCGRSTTHCSTSRLSGAVDLGGPDVIAYPDLLQVCGRAAGLARLRVPVPVVPPGLVGLGRRRSPRPRRSTPSRR